MKPPNGTRWNWTYILYVWVGKHNSVMKRLKQGLTFYLQTVYMIQGIEKIGRYNYR